jgi:hypothetical protein
MGLCIKAFVRLRLGYHAYVYRAPVEKAFGMRSAYL